MCLLLNLINYQKTIVIKAKIKTNLKRNNRGTNKQLQLILQTNKAKTNLTNNNNKKKLKTNSINQ